MFPPPRDNKVIWKKGEKWLLWQTLHQVLCPDWSNSLLWHGYSGVHGSNYLGLKRRETKREKKASFESWLRKELIRLKSAFQSTVPRILHNEQPKRPKPGWEGGSEASEKQEIELNNGERVENYLNVRKEQERSSPPQVFRRSSCSGFLFSLVFGLLRSG